MNEDAGGVLAAMTVGDRNHLSSALRSAYRGAGLSHVLVVSGMHVSILCGDVFGRRRRERSYRSRGVKALFTAFLALLLAGCVGYGTYSMGLFNTRIEGLAEASGSTGSNPLNVVLNIIPSNIITAFGSNGAVLSSVFLAVAIGLSMNTLGESRTATLRRLLGEVNDVVVVFLNFIVSNFAPFAVFVLLTRTFAIYGIDYLKPALVYVVTLSPSSARSPTWQCLASPPPPAPPPCP